METKTNEELVGMIYADKDVALAFMQLIKNLRPAMIKIGRKHLSKLHIYEIDDYIQEGSLVLWSLLKKRVYNGRAKFFNLFYTAFTFKCTNLYRDYVLKNLIIISELEDFYCYGYSVSKIAVDQYASEYRIKQRKRNKALYKKKQTASRTSSAPLTLEERRERSRQRSREYYQKNKEKCRAAKHKWYMEHREYALHYQKAYEHGVRIGRKGPCGKRR